MEPLKKKKSPGVPFVSQRVKNLAGIHEDAGPIPGLTQRVKGLALPQAVAYVTEVARWLGSGVV